MGQQLWYSKKNRYRRRGTRFAEIREVLGRGLTVQSIAEPLLSCSTRLSARKAERSLAESDFDVAGATRKDGEPPIGWVARESLKRGSVEDCLQQFAPGQLIAESTSIRQLLYEIRRQPRYFVLEGTSVAAIVTESDLNKPPVRAWLFALVSLVEFHMDFWVTETHPGDTWLTVLKPNRVEEARSLQEKRERASGKEVPLRDCLQFCDKRELFLCEPKLRQRLSLKSKKEASSRLKSAEGLRNDLSHSQERLSGVLTWGQIGDLVEWVESFLERSDREVEMLGEVSAEGAASP